jgi:hypothetical protein
VIASNRNLIPVNSSNSKKYFLEGLGVHRDEQEVEKPGSGKAGPTAPLRNKGTGTVGSI